MGEWGSIIMDIIEFPGEFTKVQAHTCEKISQQNHQASHQAFGYDDKDMMLKF